MRYGTFLLALTGSVFLSMAPALSEQALPVETVKIQPELGLETLTLTGQIIARDEVGLSFPMSGRIMSILVREGDQVQTGQELARLESVQQEQAMRGAEAALNAAQADLFQAKEEFERQDVFLQRGATTRIRRDEAERRYRIAEASVEQAQADLNRARKAYEDTFLRASADGVITARLADPGEVIAGAHPVLKLALGTAMDAVFDTPEDLPTRIPKDLTIPLSLLDNPDVRFQGRVRKVSPLVDPRTGTVEVSVGVDKPPAQVSYGAAVKASIAIPHPDQIIVPYSALSVIGQSPAVWVISPDTMRATVRPIGITRYSDGTIVIRDGLKTGDIVVTSGAQLLYPGRIVRLIGDE